MDPTPKGWPRISPVAIYSDANTAIDWLCRAFGFELRIKVTGEADRVKHSELTYHGGVVMVADDGRPDQPQSRAPASVGGANTQNMFIYVDEIEAHVARAREAGAQIVIEPAVSDYGEDYWADRGYECVDPGGHHWWFAQRLHTGATYRPKLEARELGASPPPTGWPRISSGLYYQDPRAAIDWLCSAFGFEIQIKVEGAGGRIEHSELVYGGGLIMVSDESRDPDRWPHRKSPASLGGANTQALMMYIDDVQAHCARARAAGAVITSEPKISDYGEEYWSDLSYGVDDLGGHRWWITQRVRG
jgi:uncharacterized glyoxalase superfamily protein PhnB